ncbi:hypothetical protein [Nocardioides sp. R-C-SC26]|uniref:RCC1 domain-containing protein n=1 Tax=Nocardioides sp. R-C-SC26 TaxID=2870414 RepID=UPI001E419154|nr:hypothetical protein [Nocardioides sp. R-C-SC26]
MIDAGPWHSLAVLADGSVRAWGAGGETDEGQADVPAAFTGPNPQRPVVDVAAGFYHSVALTRDARVVTWGAEQNFGDVDEGQLDVPDPLEDGTRHAIDVAAGGRHTLALDSTGRVWAWGSDDQGQVSLPAELDGTRAVAVAAYHAVSMALLDDGRVIAWGDDGTGTVSLPPELTGQRILAIDVGAEIAVALTASGRVISWGDSATPVPAAIARHAPFRTVAAGGRHVLVVHRAPKTPTSVRVLTPRQVRADRPVRVGVRVAGVESGTVMLTDGGRQVAVVRLERAGTDVATGTARLSGLKAGRHTLVATFAGTATAASASSPVRIVKVRAGRG